MKPPQKVLIFHPIVPGWNPEKKSPVMVIGQHFNFKWTVQFVPSAASPYFKFVCYDVIPVPGAKWSIRVPISIKRTDDSKKERLIEHEFSNNVREFPLIPTAEFMNSMDIDKEGNLPIELTLTFDDVWRKFDDSTMSDTTLVVGAEKLFLSKWFLAAQSQYFKNMFSAKNFSETEILIEKTDPLLFHHFMEMLHGERSISDKNVTELLKLAKDYQTPTGFRACELFLLKQSRFCVKKKYEIAAEYGLNDLKKNCLSTIKTSDDFKQILPSNLKSLGQDDLIELLELSMKFHSVPSDPLGWRHTGPPNHPQFHQPTSNDEDDRRHWMLMQAELQIHRRQMAIQQLRNAQRPQ